MIKTLDAGAEVALAARVRAPVGAEVGATPTVLQNYIIAKMDTPFPHNLEIAGFNPLQSLSLFGVYRSGVASLHA